MDNKECGCNKPAKNEKPVAQGCGCESQKPTEKSTYTSCGCSEHEPAPEKSSSSCGCGSATSSVDTSSCDESWKTGTVTACDMSIPQVATKLTICDRKGTWKARWGMGRMHYMVNPGLYAAGNPGPASPVFVTANYKMSFDALRSSIPGIDAWILVIDTNGINVWCAAGKGTFGTDELVGRIKISRLEEVVEHRQIILPQLGAPGVSAHDVKKQSGFKVVYGPVQARDLPEYMSAGMTATDKMRRVTFPFMSRITLTPVEIVFSAKYLMYLLLGAIVLSGIGPKFFSVDNVALRAPLALLFICAGYFSGTVLTPALLPVLPGRAFSTKGAFSGILTFAVLAYLTSAITGTTWSTLESSVWLLVTATLSSFLGMNFTGSSTYTSLSGVRKEMRVAVPLQLAGLVIGAVLWIVSAFV